jgi:CheY-like chemotaxis protein
LLAQAVVPTLDVLVADDDPTAVALLTLQLQHLNMHVLQASSGRQAIDLTRSRMPGLLVLDLMMPIVSGFDVVATLASDPATTHVPILVITAKSITMADRLRLDGHVSSVLQKGSFTAATFAFEVKRALQPHPTAMRN